MSDSTTTPSNPDHARLEKLESTVRRLRRWLWVALIIGIAFFSFAIGRISGSKSQMNRDHGMPGNQMRGPQGGPQNGGPQGGPQNGGPQGGPQNGGPQGGKGKGKDRS